MENSLFFPPEKDSQNRCAAKRIPRFLEEFYQMLEKATFTEYIDWNSDGTSILIKDPNQFAEKVLPVYFKHNNLASFIRQLNMYDFKKQKHPHYNYVFTHDCFRRDDRGLLKNILRKSSSEYLRYQEKKRRREETARALAQSSLRIKDPDSVFVENNMLKRNQLQMENEIANLNQQIAQYQSSNADLQGKYDSLKQEGVYLINMINALTEKLGAETIFGIIQTQMYGAEHQNTQNRSAVTSRLFPMGDNVVNEHGCATAETSSQNFDQILNDDGKSYRYQDVWDLNNNGATKKVKLESKQQQQRLQPIPSHLKPEPQLSVRLDEFEVQNDFGNFEDGKDLGLASGF